LVIKNSAENKISCSKVGRQSIGKKEKRCTSEEWKNKNLLPLIIDEVLYKTWTKDVKVKRKA
jgi:hypothetical protein